MKKHEVRIGGTYLAKVTNNVVPVRIDNENHHGGWDATNLATNKKVRIKSAQRLRGEAKHSKAFIEAKLPPAKPEPAKAKKAKPAPEPSPAAPVETSATETPKAGKTSGLDAAYQVLRLAGSPMKVKAIVQAMFSRGLWSSDGLTPSATVYSAMIREIKEKGDASRFRKVDRGSFVAADAEPREMVPAFNPADCGGAFDGNTVTSDADSGL